MTTRAQSKRRQQSNQNRDDVAALARQGYKAPDIAVRLGLGLSTVYSMMPSETKERRGLTTYDRTLRETVLDLVDGRGEYGTSEQLLVDIGSIERWARTDLHSLNHQLRQMAKQGQITMRVRNNGSAASLERIARKGPIPANKTVDKYPDGSVVIQERVPRPAPAPETRLELTETAEPVPAYVPDEYPILTALLQRWRDHADRRRQADVLLVAAEMLSDVDPVESERLLARAADVGAEPFTDVEAEYLRREMSRQADTGQAEQDARTVTTSPSGD
jgi:hypothetical protein